MGEAYMKSILNSGIWKKIGYIFVAIAIFAIIVLLCVLPLKFCNGDVLCFIAGFEAFLGTVALGALALWQNKKADQMNTKILQQDIMIRTKTYLVPQKVILHPESITEKVSQGKAKLFNKWNGEDKEKVDYVTFQLRSLCNNEIVKCIKVSSIRIDMFNGNTYTYKNLNNRYEEVYHVHKNGGNRVEYSMITGFESNNIIEEIKGCPKTTINIEATVKNIYGISVEATYVFTVKFENDENQLSIFAVNEETSYVLIHDVKAEKR